MRFTRRLFIPLQQLRWKLTLTHTAVTVGALLVVEIAAIIAVFAYFLVNSRLSPEQLTHDLNTYYVPLVRPYLSEIPPNIEGLTLYLSQLSTNQLETKPLIILGNVHLDIKSHNILNVLFISGDGTLIDTLPHDMMQRSKLGKPLDASEIPGLEAPLQAALEGEQNLRSLYTILLPENRLVGAVPVFSEDGGRRVVGALAFSTRSLPWDLLPWADMLEQIGYSLLFFTLFAGLMGTLFGSLTAGGVVRRLKRLSRSTNAWSQGDFSASVEDTTGDELSTLTSDLNHMAQQLENLLEERRQMSIMEERNRLARDLHDSAKQQAFAASAQLGAAQALWEHDPETAKAHLAEANTLIDQVRQELTYLIQELRPVALQRTGLASALREYVGDWSNQTDIQANITVEGSRSLPRQVEHSLFRIAQEALANIARHSHAQHATIQLCFNAQTTSLTITDDGQGFDVSEKRTGIGLRSMHERADLIQGNLVIISTLGQGTQVLVTCPC